MPKILRKLNNKSGFTIVELLVVIVVIGILAAITAVSYSGISQKAREASLQSDLRNAATLIEIGKVTSPTDSYPPTIGDIDNGKGLKPSDGNTYDYVYDGATNSYTLTATNGNLSYSITSSNSTPTLVTNSWLEINSDGTHTCAINAKHEAYCWGPNDFGEIGDGTTTNRLVPTAVKQGEMQSLKVKSISAGFHTCAIAENDQVYCWGRNDSGQIGNNLTTDQLTPVAVLQGDRVGLTVKSISAGSFATCAIATNDYLYCWGDGYYGELGDGTGTNRSVPTMISQGAMPSLVVKSVSAGHTHTCAIASNDRAYCWGSNQMGQIGDNTSSWGTNRFTPTAVLQGALPSLSVKSISAGGSHSCVIASNNQAYCWGGNYGGQIGDNTIGYDQSRLTPVAVFQGEMPSLSVEFISAGINHTCAIASNDQAYCWGQNSNGEIGDNTTGTDRIVPTAVIQGAMPSFSVKSLNAGYFHTCAIASNDQAYCWGQNTWGAIGDNTSGNYRLSPTLVNSI